MTSDNVPPIDEDELPSEEEAFESIKQSMEERDYENMDVEQFMKDVDEYDEPESSQRQDAGWMRFYLECPDCETPMVRTAIESETIEEGSSTTVHALCPDCKVVESTLSIERTNDTL